MVGRFSDHPLAAGLQREIAGAEVVARRIASHIGERIRFAHVLGLSPDHDNQFDFVIKLSGDLHRELDAAVVVVEGIVVFVEEHRLLGDGHADFLGMAAIIQPDTDNLLRPGHNWPILDVLFLPESASQSWRLEGSLHQSIQPRTVLILEQIIHGRRALKAQQPGCFGNIQNTLAGLNAETVFAVARMVSRVNPRAMPRSRLSSEWVGTLPETRVVARATTVLAPLRKYLRSYFTARNSLNQRSMVDCQKVHSPLWLTDSKRPCALCQG